MFIRDSKPPRIDTLIGKTARVQGDVEFEGGMHLDGEVRGAVRADPVKDTSLSVSESGAILGSVQVRDLTLNGTVKGDIHAAGRLVLGATAKIEGNVYYGIIEMTLGAQIVGKLVCLEPQGPVEAPQGAPG